MKVLKTLIIIITLPMIFPMLLLDIWFEDKPYTAIGMHMWVNGK